MPNWCSTTYAFYDNGNTENYNKFKNAMLKLYNEHMFDKTDLWLGTVAESFGLKVCDSFPYGLRGWITYVEDNNDHLTVDVQDAWSYHNGVFNLILENSFDGVNYEMVAEEPGCEIYVNTDTEHKFFNDKYVMYIEDYDTLYFENDEQLNESILWCKENGYKYDIHKYVSYFAIN